MMALNTLLKQRFYSQQLLKRVAEPTTGPGLAKQLNTDEMPIKMCPLDTFLAGRTDTMVASSISSLTSIDSKTAENHLNNKGKKSH